MGQKNIVLIGLPGCGKTTIGKILAEKTNYKFVDMDSYIEESECKTIKEIFKDGEDAFRDIETKVCKILGENSNTIISTGGGVVKRKENINYLKKNSIVVFLDRPVEDILTDIEVETRPLFANGTEIIYKLREERYNLYNEYCDYRIENVTTIEYVVNNIIDLIEKV